MGSFIIGVAGGRGSGKTFFAEALAKKLGPNTASVLYQDSYYIDQSEKFDHDGGSVNFDHPSALDFKLLAKHLAELKKNNSIQVPLYNFARHQRLKETIIFKAKKVVILDGILILGQKNIRDLIDKSIYIQTPEDIRFERRLKRDVETRGRTPEGVKKQFEKQVKPMHDLFVAPSMEFADIVNSGTDIKMFHSLLDKLTNELNL